MLHLKYKMNVKRNDEFITLSNLSIHYIRKKIKSYQNNKFKLSGLTWNEEFESAGTTYSVLHTLDYFEYINKEHETPTDNRPIQTYINEVENKITFKINSGNKFELLTQDTMKLLRS